LGVEISTIVPQGRRIKRDDVQRAYEARQSGPAVPAAAAPAVTKKPLSSIRRRTAAHMDRSARTVARVGLTVEVDATGLMATRAGTLVDGTKVSYNVLLAQQVATALQEFPYMNAQLKEDEIWEYAQANIGIAVDTERGLLVPVLQGVNGKSVEALQREFLALTGRALEGKSSVADLEGGTFTITNMGSLEIESFLPVINLPECAILGVGAILEKAVVVDGGIKIQPRMKLTLAFDHRLVDGAPAGRFLQRLKTLIEAMSN
jgi:pyruvate dehydrogenase E2 component (dihydrolipoamide acetyltransferase)